MSTLLGLLVFVYIAIVFNFRPIQNAIGVHPVHATAAIANKALGDAAELVRQVRFCERGGGAEWSDSSVAASYPSDNPAYAKWKSSAAMFAGTPMTQAVLAAAEKFPWPAVRTDGPPAIGLASAPWYMFDFNTTRGVVSMEPALQVRGFKAVPGVDAKAMATLFGHAASEQLELFVRSGLTGPGEGAYENGRGSALVLKVAPSLPWLLLDTLAEHPRRHIDVFPRHHPEGPQLPTEVLMMDTPTRAQMLGYSDVTQAVVERDDLLSLSYRRGAQYRAEPGIGARPVEFPTSATTAAGSQSRGFTHTFATDPTEYRLLFLISLVGQGPP